MPRPTPRLYAGEQLRAIRRTAGLNQAAMAARLGISVSYLSQLESGDRPLTPSVTAALRRRHPGALIESEAPAMRLTGLATALADPVLPPAPPSEAIERLAEERPEIADRIIALHTAMRAAEERLQMVEESMASGISGAARMPWEAVRDWFHIAGNYVDPLDRAAEALAEQLGPEEAAFATRLAEHGITIVATTDETAPLRALDRRRGTLTLNGALPPESRRFLIAHQLAAIEFAGTIDEIVNGASASSIEARNLLRIGLANYAAGALTMPYARFRTVARQMRHDIDRLCRRFGVSFEQACHRLSTLQRPGAEGIPFYFCRVDMAGNITKRHSATRLQFARFGGACPLWIVHEAVAIPDRIVVQHAETPDGVRYVSMAKGLVKPSGSFTRSPRRYAVTLGCEAEHAADFVYADALDRSAPPIPIGISCRLCPRDDCDQRAFPPADRDITVDPDLRGTVPYRVV
ncbi:MAG: family transcriptional regulator [Sphingomonas bacterium]|uniref:helix-turn-helix domain-containing protein n=1 Tax=Sphingomonas bacterium TaxID=1895847 RepID=UPI00260C61EB|nr:helix-turn-helix transcriptional regulator [Sphingomonas bacterium]MDB5707925.1 family transcriptional regulator [Sphingomonas bacterium]